MSDQQLRIELIKSSKQLINSDNYLQYDGYKITPLSAEQVNVDLLNRVIAMEYDAIDGNILIRKSDGSLKVIHGLMTDVKLENLLKFNKRSERGPQGLPGEDGLNGRDGREGPPGCPGPRGDRGLTGVRGDQGPMGPRGDIGDKGLPGLQGLKGPKGFTGDVGPMGPRGLRGKGVRRVYAESQASKDLEVILETGEI